MGATAKWESRFLIWLKVYVGDCDRQMYDALKASTDGIAYKIVRRVEPFVNYGLECSHVGLDASVPLMFDVLRHVHFEYLLKSQGAAPITRLIHCL